MFRNYFKTAVRNFSRNKIYGLINVMGLAIGMGVAILTGLWINDELSFDKYNQHYDRLARVEVNRNFNGTMITQRDQPFLLGQELENKFGDDFANVCITSWNYGHFVQYNDIKLSKNGMFAEPGFTEMLSLKMLKGSKKGLQDMHSIIINETVAKAFFGDTDPLGKVMKIDNQSSVSVTGVFEDIPQNSEFSKVEFLLPWSLYVADYNWVKSSAPNWGSSFFLTFAQLKPSADFAKTSARIKDVIIKNNPLDEAKPQLFLNPMSRWHLYSNFKNSINTGGNIEFVWLFGVIGVFVLLLACINFMNLSTARSEKRAKEVGIRKAIGSLRKQLIIQFLSESFLIVLVAFVLSLLFVQLSLGWFNQIADKNMIVPFANPYFCLTSVTLVLVTSLIAGSYPALYLSAFKPVKILKGTFKAGRLAVLPRKILVVTQFTVSLILIIGTIVVYRQVMFAKDRPIGYDSNGLVTTYGYPFSDFSNSPKRYDFLRNELMKTGAVINMAKSSSTTTNLYSNQTAFGWQGKDPNVTPNFGVVFCTHDYGNTVGFEFKEGRDFSRAFPTDTAAVILNETAVRFIGMKDPLGKTITYNNNVPLKIIGVVHDMLMESPFSAIRPTAFMVSYSDAQVISMKLNPALSAKQALSKIEPKFKAFNPENLFEVQFADKEFNYKFINEDRIAKLVSFFATLALFISCLGLFGLVSFVAEQRTKEIGIRKVMGATVLKLWQMLSREFVELVAISCLIAVPVASYLVDHWLRQYEYRTTISVWIFAVAGLSTLIISLLTISFQAIKAASANPVKCLRTE